MRQERRLTWEEVSRRARRLYEHCGPEPRLWGIPRGGTYVAAVMAGLGAQIAFTPHEADLAVDDIIDSGRTAARIKNQFGLETIALFDRFAAPFEEWLVFPWEEDTLEHDAHDTVTRLIQQIGDDPNRDGLRKTPERVVHGWQARFAGYEWHEEDMEAVARLLREHAEPHNGGGDVRVVRGIAFDSTCERHLQPFYGAFDIAWGCVSGDGRADGIAEASLPRLVSAYAHRLTIQERLTNQVAQTIAHSGLARGVLARSEATLHCVGSDGRCRAGQQRTEEALRFPDGGSDQGIESRLREALQ